MSDRTEEHINQAQQPVIENVERKKKRKKKPAVQEVEHPCSAASKAAYSCLKDNGYQRKPCEPFFEAYKQCMWLGQEEMRRIRAQKGGGLFG